MKNTRLFKKTVIASALALASTQTFAAGFQLNAQSATGLGRAFAGDAVIADNASVMARNSAAMALFDSHQFSGGVNVINTDISVKDISYKMSPLVGGATVPVDDAKNSSSTPVPNIYYIHRLNDKIALGAGIYSNFGTKNNFEDDFGAGVFGGTTEISTVNYALSASYRINEQLSVGAGLDIVTGSGKMSRTHNVSLIGNVLEIDANGTGYGFNVGTVYEVDENNRFGLSYHYSPEVKAKGTVKIGGVDYDSVGLPLPDMLEFSGYHKLEGTKFAVHYSAQWIGWSVFDKLETNTGREIKDYEWKDGYHISLGGTYYMNEAIAFRAGYMYDTAAQDKITSISVPDSDRQWFSAGMSYSVEKHTFDVGVTYLLGKDVSVTDTNSTLVETVTATTHANAILAGVQYSYSF
ncbi:outer membrane protein transport protein [Vibrio sp. SCSIO 43136]|uniref:OmpP1/FadL family transporter n=1 Tax=Vibrio sp. SCSIO 43136 TaxID=2819101 RepID=UPI002075E753|nr:outer membrane protein transport protein [Vibrio sp. SCSIO 43136]USD66010.1 outer membrane protein transport protein [Vibrio sp. SCSIO 43136]